MGFQIELDLRNHNKLLLEENEQLQAKVAELEEENARLNSSPTIEACRQMIRDKAVIEASTLHEQLTAAQAECEFQRNAHKQAEELMLEQSNQLAAAQKEIEQLKATPPDKREDLRCVISDLCRQVQERDAKLASSEQLAAEQLNNKLLRDALQEYIDEHEECQDADDWMAMMCSMEAHHTADEALSQPSDTSALDSFVAEKVKECADEARRQMQHATKAVWQRDLAVEALLEVFPYEQHKALGCDCPTCEALSTITDAATPR